MKRLNIIKIDVCLLDSETGEFDFRLSINKEFIKEFGIDMDVLKKDLENLIDNMIENSNGGNE